MDFIVTIILTVGSSVTLDVNPTLVLPVETAQYGFSGTSWVPHVVTYDPEYPTAVPHELVHARQWTALGPGFPIAYAMTAGRAFEDYRDMMWEAPPDMHNNCPMFRVQGNSLSFMPCWQMGH